MASLMIEPAPGLPAVNSTVHIDPIDGASHRVGADDTAYAYRDANFETNDRGHDDRLVEVRRAYDPDNLFHVNQDIVP